MVQLIPFLFSYKRLFFKDTKTRSIKNEMDVRFGGCYSTRRERERGSRAVVVIIY